MTILLLSGPPAAGKNAIAAAFAGLVERCAVIDVDLVRWMIVRPHAALWDGAEGMGQQRLGVLNACQLARTFVAHDFTVLIHDVISPDTARLYRQELASHHPMIVRRLPTFAEVVRRGGMRPPRLTAAEIRMLYDAQRDLSEYDHTIDNTARSAEEVAAQLLALLARR